MQKGWDGKDFKQQKLDGAIANMAPQSVLLIHEDKESSSSFFCKKILKSLYVEGNFDCITRIIHIVPNEQALTKTEAYLCEELAPTSEFDCSLVFTLEQIENTGFRDIIDEEENDQKVFCIIHHVEQCNMDTFMGVLFKHIIPLLQCSCHSKAIIHASTPLTLCYDDEDTNKKSWLDFFDTIVAFCNLINLKNHEGNPSNHFFKLRL